MAADVRERVVRCLREIAPDADPATVAGDADLRDALDLDSMDFLRFVQAIDRELGVTVEEADYPAVRTLDGCIRHLRALLDGKERDAVRPAR